MSPIRRAEDYANLKTLLEKQETFPHQYMHKFIGRNTAAFTVSVQAWEAQQKRLKKKTERLSQGSNLIALTYIFEAHNADEIISLLQSTELIDDVQIIL